jgi:transcription initiation protein SPT3
LFIYDFRAFGDSSVNGQHSASIILVEKIVVQQMRAIMNEAMNVAFKRSNSLIPSQVDFEFLMRRNPAKLQRFRKYMKNVKRLKADQNQGMNFLNRLSNEDNSSDEVEIYDVEKTRKLFRADRISQVLSPQRYEEYQKARSWASNIRNKTEMMRKLMELMPKEIQQEQSMCLEIILFLVQETIATIVDFAILTRLNTDNQVKESFTISSCITNNMLHLCTEVTDGRGQDGIKAITVQEINEAMRRVQTMSNRRMGSSFRNINSKIPFLAL